MYTVDETPLFVFRSYNVHVYQNCLALCSPKQYPYLHQGGLLENLRRKRGVSRIKIIERKSGPKVEFPEG